MLHPNVYVEFYNGTSWVDISAYVTSDINYQGGFFNNDPTAYTAGSGMLTFDLNNKTKLFTVYGGDSVRGLSTLTGWNRGSKIRVRVVYLNFNQIVWAGFIQDIKSDDMTWGEQKAHVTCMDWIDIASNYSMKRSDILLNKNLGDGIASIVNRVALTPEGFISGTYTSTFPAIFDNVRSRTKAISEIDKLARSENGYVYITKDGYVVAEGFTARKGTDSLTQVPAVSDEAIMYDSNTALMFDSNTVLLADAGSNSAKLTSVAEKLQLTMSDEYWNQGVIRGYPTVTDTSLVTLFSIGDAIPIQGGAYLQLTGNYINPNGGLPVNGTNMQTPVSTTDYLMNTKADGTGSDITAFLSVAADYYGDVVVYMLHSTYTAGIGYITRLKARGYGIYRNTATETQILITGSASAYGDKAFEINQTYQTDTYAGSLAGASILELYKVPKTRISQVTFCANINNDNLMAYLYLDIGDLIPLYDSRSGMTKWYHITSIKTLITLGAIIIFTFGVREFPNLANGGLNPVTVSFDGINPFGTSDAVDFGYLPEISGDNVTAYTWATWIYLRTINANFTTILNLYASSAANTYFYFQGGSPVKLTLQSYRFDGGAGRWRIPSDAFVTGTWTHVAVSYDLSSVSNDPVIYLNGVAQTLTEEQTPSGLLLSAVGTHFVVGSNGSYANSIDGMLKDVRVYNRVLSASEVATLYNNGVMDTSLVTNGMVFQGLCINSDLGDKSTLNNQQLPADNKFFENIFRRVGEIKATPTIVNQ